MKVTLLDLTCIIIIYIIFFYTIIKYVRKKSLKSAQKHTQNPPSLSVPENKSKTLTLTSQRVVRLRLIEIRKKRLLPPFR